MSQKKRIRAGEPSSVGRYGVLTRALSRTTGIVLKEMLRAHAISGHEAVSVHIAVLSHAQMTVLKRKALLQMSLKKRKQEEGHFPNVLAFPEPPGFPHPEVHGRLLGEVYLNASVLAKEGMPRFVYLMIHGILHCVGYDHLQRRDMIIMERWERRLMRVVYKQ